MKKKLVLLSLVLIALGGFFVWLNETYHVDSAGVLKSADKTPQRVSFGYKMLRPSTRFVRLKSDPTPTRGKQARKAKKNKKVAKKKVDKKKKKTAKKKKEKKKTKKVAKKTPKAPSQNKDSQPNNKSNDKKTPTAGVAGSPQPAPGVPPTENETLSADDWRARVLAKPSLKVTTEFVEAFASSEIQSEDFYSIIDEMLEDSHPDMRGLGVWALGSTKSSESFSRLALHSERESSGTQIYNQINLFLDDYKSQKHFSILRSALLSESRASVIRAAEMIESLAERTQELVGGPHPSRTVRGRRTASQSQRDYAAFITILRELSEDSDAKISNSAIDALEQIENLGERAS